MKVEPLPLAVIGPVKFSALKPGDVFTCHQGDNRPLLKMELAGEKIYNCVYLLDGKGGSWGPNYDCWMEHEYSITRKERS